MTALQQELERVSGVRNVHHVHLWKMNDTDIHFEAHIDVDDVSVSSTGVIRREIEAILNNNHDINHTTLQLECDSCRTKDLV